LASRLAATSIEERTKRIETDLKEGLGYLRAKLQALDVNRVELASISGLRGSEWHGTDVGFALGRFLDYTGSLCSSPPPSILGSLVLSPSDAGSDPDLSNTTDQPSLDSPQDIQLQLEKNRDIEEFEDKQQWETLAPFFSRTSKEEDSVSHYELPWRLPLPFEIIPDETIDEGNDSATSGSTSGSDSSLNSMKRGHGRLWKVRINRKHHNLQSYRASGSIASSTASANLTNSPG